MSAKRLFALTILLGLVMALQPASLMAIDKDKDKDEYKGSYKKIMAMADALYARRDYVEAIEAYQAALKKEASSFRATYRIGKCYWFTREIEESVRYYEQAIQIDNNANDTVYFDLGIAYKSLDRYNDAREQFVNFRKRYKPVDDYARRVKMEIKGCDSVEVWREMEALYRAEPGTFNTSAGDQFPAMLNQNGQDSFLVFTSHRGSSKGNEGFGSFGEQAKSDLWIVKIENDTVFGVVENLGKKVNTKGNDGSATFTPDGSTMIYSICNYGKFGYGCSLYESKYDPNKKAWRKPKVIKSLNGFKTIQVNRKGKTKKVPTWDAQPCLSPDGNTIYFVSDREGGTGKLDIWYSTREGEEWGEPKNCGPNVNTEYNDMSPFISRNGNDFFFASDGRIGYGGFDIYQTSGYGADFAAPSNLKAPINSSYDDFGAIWAKNDSLAYFTSDRPNDSGERDCIFFARKKEKPPYEVAVHGVVRDKKSLQPVQFATVILFEYDFEDELIPIDTFNTGPDAAYNFQLEPNKKYKVVGNAPEYLANEEVFDTHNIDEDTDIEKNVDIELERIEIDVPIVLNNIFYDFDEYFLREESKAELDRLTSILTKNPNITVTIDSHTDTNGSDDYNKTLSENRAKSVVVYLIQESGIDPNRLSWFGWGETKPLVYPELSDEDEQLNRRSEFRIRSIEFGEVF